MEETETYLRSETNQQEIETQTWKNLKRAESEAKTISEDLREQRNKLTQRTQRKRKH